MAFFRLRFLIDSDRPMEAARTIIQAAGLTIDSHFSGSCTLFAKANHANNNVPNPSIGVDVLVLRDSSKSKELQIEVRSSESMLIKGTACESIAKTLEAAFASQLSHAR